MRVHILCSWFTFYGATMMNKSKNEFFFPENMALSCLTQAWYSTVWFGLIRCSLVWFDPIRSNSVQWCHYLQEKIQAKSRVQFGSAWWSSSIWSGLVRSYLIQFGIVQSGLVLSDLVWSGLVWFNSTWFCLVWFGLTWLGLVLSDPEKTQKE